MLNVLDMLRKVSLISLTPEDNIQVKGNTDFKILINGCSSSLMAGNPKDVLKNMPANTLQRIEIITTPPAKYDVEGLGGIINIITNKKMDEGYNGALGVSHNSLGKPG